MTFEQGMFYILAGVMMFSAVMMLVNRNPVNSAL
jgi:NADH:ubiquinone oxidoreductase subunit 6 (subunit J)